jgi:L-alanine-DL-glutamate epimerase-like enolase superfamily enzyme
VALRADGSLAVPDAPGLGAVLDEEAVAFYAVSGRDTTLRLV